MCATPASFAQLRSDPEALHLDAAFGMAECWLVPAARWSCRAGEMHFAAHGEAILSTFGRGGLLERISGPLAGRRGGDDPGTIALSLGREARSYAILRPTAVAHIYLRRSLLADLAAEPGGGGACAGDRIFEHDPTLVREMHGYLRRAQDADDPPGRMEMDARGVLLALRVMASPATSRRATFGVRQRARLTELIDAHLHEDLSLLQLAEAVGCGRSQFLALFRRTFGTSPHQHVIACRVARAQGLLQSGAKLAEIALACGFASQQHFSTVFRSVTGSTPTAFRDVTHA